MRSASTRAWAIARKAGSNPPDGRAPEARLPTAPSPTEHPVGRALDPARPSVQDVGIDLGCAHVAMTEQVLNRPDVVAILQQVRGERVAEGVAARRLGDARPADRVLNRALQNGLVQVVPSALSRHAIDINSRRRKHPLPGPLPA